METPYNENLCSRAAPTRRCSAPSGEPLPAGTRDQVEVGLQQAFGRWVVADVGYFYKHTTNAYDFGVLFDTPIFFPVAWDTRRSTAHGRVNSSSTAASAPSW